jgi:hypothetical protein
MSKKFYEDAMPSIEIFSKEFVLTLTIIVQRQSNHITVHTHLSGSSGTLVCWISERTLINVGLVYSGRPCTLFCRRRCA